MNRCGTGWIAGAIVRAEVAAEFDAMADKVLAADMVDPKQNIDFKVGTSPDRMRLALQTLDSEFSTIDGTVIDKNDAVIVRTATATIRRIVDSIETKLAGYSAKHKEKPPSGR